MKGLSGLRPLFQAVTQRNPFWKAWSSPSWYIQLFKRRVLKYQIKNSINEGYPMYVIFSCDLELDPPWNTKSWQRQTYFGLEKGMPILLNLLKKYNIKATFFCEGRLADVNPGLIIDLKEEGHEIGCHGYAHESYGGHYKLILGAPPPKFLTSKEKNGVIRVAKGKLEEVINKPVASFRAPFLHIDNETVTMLDEIGFSVDSSISNSVFGKLSKPYHPLKKNLLKEGKELNSQTCGLLEIPIFVNPMPCFLPHRPYVQIYPKDIRRATEALKILIALSRIEKIPTIVLLLSHCWEFTDTKTPYGVSIGEKRTELLDQFLRYLSSLNGFCSVTMSQMCKIWEDKYCPIHASLKGKYSD